MFARSMDRGGRGLRPSRVFFDLNGIADLLDLAFQEEIRGIAALGKEDFSSLKGLGPLIWFLGLFWPPLGETFSGFVWEEGGRIVGNVNLERLGRGGRVWIIGNLAVHPDFRRRGIGRSLTLAAIARARECGGELVTLEVRAENTPAYDLYRSLGFQSVESITELRWEGRALLPSPGAGENVLRRLGRGDKERVLHLAERAIPRAAQVINPIRAHDYLPHPLLDWPTRAFYGLLGLWPHRLGLERQEKLVAYLSITPIKGGLGQCLSILVDPENRGKVEDTLIREGLSLLGPHLSREVWGKARTEEEREALVGCGFREVQCLHRLVLDLR